MPATPNPTPRVLRAIGTKLQRAIRDLGGISKSLDEQRQVLDYLAAELEKAANGSGK